MYKRLFLICLLTTNLIGCTQESEQKQVSANDYKFRAEVFLDGYADIEIVNIASDSLNIESNEPYHDELSYIDTLDAVSGQAKKYKEKDLGLTTVMLTKDDKLDCIIVYKNSMSVETTNHELAHCFYPLVREVIKTKKSRNFRNSR